MRVRSLLRVVLAMFLSATAICGPMMFANGAAAQTANGFVMDATRMCGESLALRWDATNVKTIEFSVTDTSLNWTTGWIEATDFESQFHYEPIGQRFDKVSVRVTFNDGQVSEYHQNIGACVTEITTPAPSLDDDGGDGVPPGGGGHSAPEPHDGSYTDPETGNSFEFLTASRMCEDNRLVATWTGSNITDLDFMIYSPANGWGGTEWLEADTDSGSFTAAVEQDSAYMVDAAVTFTDDSVVVVSANIPNCTEESTVVDAGIGENNLRVQIALPDDVDISGAPFNLFAPQAAAQAVADPYISGFVGANNTVAVDGLIAGQYRLVVYPEGMNAIEALITVGDQPVTNAVVTVNADGTVTVAYAGQSEPDAEEPTSEGGTTSGTSGSAVSGLPSTGAGLDTSSAAVSLIAFTSAAVAIAAGSFVIRRKAA